MDHEFELAFNLLDEAAGRIQEQQYGITRAFRQVIWPQRSARILAPPLSAGLFASGGGFAGA